MAPDDLTTLAAVKTWLGLPSAASASDPTLAGLVTAASRAIYALLNRPAVLPRLYDETLDGEGERIALRHWPALSVESLVVDGRSVPALDPDGPRRFGYLLQNAEAAPPGRQQFVDLFGRHVGRGRQNVVVAYRAGYAMLGEPQAVPAAAPLQLSALAPFGPWGCDLGAAYASSGAALQPVSSGPQAGQYSVSVGVYQFAEPDAGAAVTISYGYIPQDLVQAATELAAERFRAAERIGLRSKSVGGQETVAFDPAPVSASVLALLRPYRRVMI